MQDKVADFMIEFEGVAKVMTAYSLTHTSFPEGINRLVQNSFSHKRSGDVLFCIHPTWVSELKELEQETIASVVSLQKAVADVVG